MLTEKCKYNGAYHSCKQTIAKVGKVLKRKIKSGIVVAVNPQTDTKLVVIKLN